MNWLIAVEDYAMGMLFITNADLLKALTELKALVKTQQTNPQLTQAVAALAATVAANNKEVIQHLDSLYALTFTILKPGSFRVEQLPSLPEDGGMALRYKANFPTIPAGNPQKIDQQKFSYNVDSGVDLVSDPVGPEVTAMRIGPIPIGSSVSLSMAWVNANGITSATKTQSFVAADTIPPDAPGDFGGIDLETDTEPDGPPTVGVPV